MTLSWLTVTFPTFLQVLDPQNPGFVAVGARFYCSTSSSIPSSSLTSWAALPQWSLWWCGTMASNRLFGEAMHFATKTENHFEQNPSKTSIPGLYTQILATFSKSSATKKVGHQVLLRALGPDSEFLLRWKPWNLAIWKRAGQVSSVIFFATAKHMLDVSLHRRNFDCTLVSVWCVPQLTNRLVQQEWTPAQCSETGLCSDYTAISKFAKVWGFGCWWPSSVVALLIRGFQVQKDQTKNERSQGCTVMDFFAVGELRSYLSRDTIVGGLEEVDRQMTNTHGLVGCLWVPSFWFPMGYLASRTSTVRRVNRWGSLHRWGRRTVIFLYPYYMAWRVRLRRVET